jgi:hypothetical protein
MDEITTTDRTYARVGIWAQKTSDPVRAGRCVVVGQDDDVSAGS